MMDLYPNIFNLILIDNSISKPTSNIAVKIRLFARHKNDYYLIPPVSNDKGKIELRKSWLNDEIEKIRNLFMMDYSSTLDDCEPKMEIKVMNMNEVNQSVKAMNQWKSVLNISNLEIECLSRVDNDQYEPMSQLINFYGESVVDIEFKIKNLFRDY